MFAAVFVPVSQQFFRRGQGGEGSSSVAWSLSSLLAPHAVRSFSPTHAFDRQGGDFRYLVIAGTPPPSQGMILIV